MTNNTCPSPAQNSLSLLRGWSHRRLHAPSVNISDCNSVKSDGLASISQHSPRQFHGRKRWCDRGGRAWVGHGWKTIKHFGLRAGRGSYIIGPPNVEREVPIGSYAVWNLLLRSYDFSHAPPWCSQRLGLHSLQVFLGLKLSCGGGGGSLG